MAKSAWLRGLSLLLVLAVVAAGMPGVKVHAHAADEHAHLHAGFAADHDHPLPPPGDAPDGAVLHVHSCAPSCAALPTALPLPVLARTPDRWLSSLHSGSPAAATWPPPHRPPIA